MKKSWAVLVVYPNGVCSLMRREHDPQRVVTFDKRTANVNADLLKSNLGDEVSAVVAVRHPLVLR